MVVLRVGGGVAPYTRYLDLLMHGAVDRLIVLTQRGSGLGPGLRSACQRVKGLCEKKLVIAEFLPPLHLRLLRRMVAGGSRYSWKSRATAHLAGPLAPWFVRRKPPEMVLRLIDRYSPDLIWTGSNDFDGSNFLTWWISEHVRELPLVRSYKEHRCTFVLDEMMALRTADALILPTRRNLRALEAVYKCELEGKTLFADEDWRYSELVKYVRTLRVKKLSETDGEPHVVILTGVATYGAADSRRNSRYNYLPIIRTLVAHKVHVHLHAKRILESTDRPVVSTDNPYAKLASQSGFFHIEPPLELDPSWDGYAILKRYDAGILHNYVEGEPITAFTQMNIPNRLYEYLIADVLPIVIRGTMLDVQEMVESTGYGIVVQSYDAAAEWLHAWVATKPRNMVAPKVPTFVDFTNTLLCAAQRLVGSSRHCGTLADAAASLG